MQMKCRLGSAYVLYEDQSEILYRYVCLTERHSTFFRVTKEDSKKFKQNGSCDLFIQMGNETPLIVNNLVVLRVYEDQRDGDLGMTGCPRVVVALFPAQEKPPTPFGQLISRKIYEE